MGPALQGPRVGWGCVGRTCRPIPHPSWDPAFPQDSLWSPLPQFHLLLLLEARPGDFEVLFYLLGEETYE